MMRFTKFLGLGACLAGMVGARSGIMEVLDGWKYSPYARYPTDFTRGIIPVCYFFLPERLVMELVIDGGSWA